MLMVAVPSGALVLHILGWGCDMSWCLSNGLIAKSEKQMAVIPCKCLNKMASRYEICTHADLKSGVTQSLMTSPEKCLWVEACTSLQVNQQADVRSAPMQISNLV
jgi:hypothetical protein